METIIEHVESRSTFTISTDERKYKNALAKLRKEHPDEVERIAENADGSVMYHVPASWVRVRPPRKVNLTDERREELAARMRSLHETQ